ncbi:phosphoribosylamine--glycine ligase [Gilvibacter sp. SZ-19]|uniref:phosphoribosylamine--glycine ligase n=1 Tax=Gilvibacter sp. SZ-19 TaxID=754429 RepID=UPI000B3C2DA9|nr:phosphoribosylamine--glycine ligase [Gilvibacter sp. SZ-19]ARV11824.1 phosphoribosylamine--glycine ligase [Gilvibacter sp. SZ-19]
MNILIIGSGGREHALAHKIVQSPKCEQLFVAPGNAGTATIASNVALGVSDFEGIKALVLKEGIGLVVVGPEAPLVDGIYDFFKADERLKEVAVVGPSQEAAQLEGSKDYAKRFMARHNIPTAAYQSFNADTLEAGKQFLETLNAPYVLKADGLAAGKGVLILEDLDEAKRELENMLANQKFGAASSTVVIEEFLDGIELSVFVLTDGKDYKILPNAKDYKRIGEGDTGLNTGGMGAVSPVPFADEAFLKKVEDQVVIPTVNGLKEEGLTYRGFIFLGLIKVGDSPKVIEYNVRMGDPETEVVIPRIQSDLVDLLLATDKQTLGTTAFEVNPQAATTVMLVSGGYPEAYEKGKTITGIEKVEDAIVFHAGTAEKDGQVVTNGGRVIAVTALADDYKQALKKSYQNAAKLQFDTMYYRTDIGFDLS